MGWGVEHGAEGIDGNGERRGFTLLGRLGGLGALWDPPARSGTEPRSKTILMFSKRDRTSIVASSDVTSSQQTFANRKWLFADVRQSTYVTLTRSVNFLLVLSWTDRLWFASRSCFRVSLMRYVRLVSLQIRLSSVTLLHPIQRVVLFGNYVELLNK